MIIRSSCNGEFEQRVPITHVDDVYFWTSGEGHEKKMQETK